MSEIKIHRHIFWVDDAPPDRDSGGTFRAGAQGLSQLAFVRGAGRDDPGRAGFLVLAERLQKHALVLASSRETHVSSWKNWHVEIMTKEKLP